MDVTFVITTISVQCCFIHAGPRLMFAVAEANASCRRSVALHYPYPRITNSKELVEASLASARSSVVAAVI